MERNSEVYRRQAEEAAQRIRDEWPRWMRANLTHPDARQAVGLPPKREVRSANPEAEAAS